MYSWIQSIAGSNSLLALIYCLVTIVPVALCSFALVIANLRTKKDKKINQLHHTYLNTIFWFAIVVIILNLVIGLCTWYESINPADRTSIAYSITYQSNWNPWMDVITNSRFSKTIYDLHAKSISISAITSFFALLVFVIAFATADHASDEDEFRKSRFNRWVARHHKITLGLILISILLGSIKLKLIQDPNQIHNLLFPIQAWISLIILAIFIFCRLLIPNLKLELDKSNDKLKTSFRPSKFERISWEKYMEDKGFKFLTNSINGEDLKPVIKSRTIKEQQESEFGKHLNISCLWSHQDKFIRRVLDIFQNTYEFEAIESKFDKEAEIALPLHNPYGSGKSIAIYALVSDLFARRAKSSLIIYPTLKESRIALETYNELIKVNRYKGTFAHQRKEGHYIFFTYADWVAENLLRSTEDSSGQIADFLENLGLVVYEDIQFYSGIAATNLSIINRRLFGLFRKHEKCIHLCLTMSVNPTELSGVMEFTRFICTPAQLEEHDISCEAPSLDVYAYCLKKTLGLKDVQGIDSLPAIVQAAWMSKAFDLELEQQAQSKAKKSECSVTGYQGVPVTLLRSDLTMVSMSDLVKPKWVDEVYSEHEPNAFVNGKFCKRSGEAWISFIEIDAKGLLSLPTHIEHAGINLKLNHQEIEDHLVVFKTSLLDRKVLEYLIKSWFKFTRQDIDSTNKISGLNWQDDVLPLGNRLIAGHPNHDLMLKHVHSTIHERNEGITYSELKDIFTDVESLNWCLNNLQFEKKSISRKPTRVLTKNNEIEDVERYHCKLREHPYNMQIWIPSGKIVKLTDISDQEHKQLDRSVDAQSVLRCAYPGKLFMQGQNHRYRVVADQYHNVVSHIINNKKFDEDILVTCEITDLQGLTIPICKKKIILKSPNQPRISLLTAPKNSNDVSAIVSKNKVELSSVRSPLQEVNFDQGIGISYLRVNLGYEYQHLGYLQLQDNTENDDVQYTFESWEGMELKQEIEGHAYLFCFTELPELSDLATETLKRMIYTTLNIILQIKSEAFDVIIEKNRSISFNTKDNKIPTIKLEGPCLYIVDPYEGGKGLLDALGSSPTPLLKKIFQFLFKWSKDLQEKNDVSWEDLGMSGIDYLSPDLLKLATKRYRSKWMSSTEASIYKSEDDQNEILLDKLSPDLEAVAEICLKVLGKNGKKDE